MSSYIFKSIMKATNVASILSKSMPYIPYANALLGFVKPHIQKTLFTSFTKFVTSSSVVSKILSATAEPSVEDLDNIIESAEDITSDGYVNVTASKYQIFHDAADCVEEFSDIDDIKAHNKYLERLESDPKYNIGASSNNSIYHIKNIASNSASLAMSLNSLTGQLRMGLVNAQKMVHLGAETLALLNAEEQSEQIACATNNTYNYIKTIGGTVGDYKSISPNAPTLDKKILKSLAAFSIEQPILTAIGCSAAELICDSSNVKNVISSTKNIISHSNNAISEISKLGYFGSLLAMETIFPKEAEISLTGESIVEDLDF